MIQLSAVELRNRCRGERPVVVVTTRRRSPPSDTTRQAAGEAAEALQVEAVAFDVDNVDHKELVQELTMTHVPELLIYRRGVLLERVAGVRDVEDARAVIATAIRGR